MRDLINSNPLFLNIVLWGSKIICVLLLFLFYRSRKKRGTSIGPWIWSVALSFALLAGAPKLFLLLEQGVVSACIDMVVFFLATIILNNRAMKSVRKALLDKKAKIDFYNKCVTNGVTALDTEKNIARAQAIAKEYSVSAGIDVKKFFAECKSLSEQENKQNAKKQKDEQLQIKRINERSDYERLSCYSQCRENEKTVQILEKMLQKQIDEQKRRESFQRRASSVMLEKEKDWASLGGAASAIGGPAAGIAVALDAQAKNAEIRARNAETSANLAQFQGYLDKSVEAMAGAAGGLRKSIADEKIKLTKKLDRNEVLEHIDITVDNVDISETGAFRVKASVKLKKPIVIYEDVSARIDGSFSCVLSQNGKAVGEAKLVLPLYGVHNSKRTTCVVEGICLKGAAPDVPYTVAVVLDNMWAVEN